MNVRSDMVAVYVVRPDATGGSHELLQLRRAAGDYMGGTFQTVSGTSEPGETASQAALRELREETGLAPAEFYRLGSCETFYIPAGETVWLCPAFCAVVARDARVALNDEHDDLRWVPVAGAEDFFMWSSQWPSLDEIRRVILGNGPAKPHLRIDVESAFTRP